MNDLIHIISSLVTGNSFHLMCGFLVFLFLEFFLGGVLSGMVLSGMSKHNAQHYVNVAGLLTAQPTMEWLVLSFNLVYHK